MIVVKCDLCGAEKGVCEGGRVQIQDFPITRNISECMMYMEVCPDCLKSIKQAVGSMMVKKIISGSDQNEKKKIKKFVVGAIFALGLLVSPTTAKADGPCDVSVEDLDLMAKVVEAEAGNQDLTGKRLVVDVILNRVDSPLFPNTVREVIYQNGQFSTVGVISRGGVEPSIESYSAVLLENDVRINSSIVFFSRKRQNYATNYFKYQDHWFGCSK